MRATEKIEALQPRPFIQGTVLAEHEGAILLRAGGCVVEIPLRHVASRTKKGENVELTLTPDAEVVVSALVSTTKGFLGDDVFGALAPGLVSSNCNCNCNCSGNCNCNCNCECSDCTECSVCTGSIVFSRPDVSTFRTRFTGGAKK